MLDIRTTCWHSDSSQQPWSNTVRVTTSTSVAAACHHETTRYWPQPTQRLQVQDQEDEAGTITNLQLRFWKLNSEMCIAVMPISAEKMCGKQLSSYTSNSTAARRNWRRRPHSSCRVDFQCSGGRDALWNCVVPSATVWKDRPVLGSSSMFTHNCLPA